LDANLNRGPITGNRRPDTPHQRWAERPLELIGAHGP
jgi:hypothetical protein